MAYPDKDRVAEEPTVDCASDAQLEADTQMALDAAETSRFARAQRASLPPVKYQGEVSVTKRAGLEQQRETEVLTDPGAEMLFHLGEDVYGRDHAVRVRLERSGDGTLGVRLDSYMGSVTLRADAGNSYYVTSHRADKMPKA